MAVPQMHKAAKPQKVHFIVNVKNAPTPVKATPVVRPVHYALKMLAPAHIVPMPAPANMNIIAPPPKQIAKSLATNCGILTVSIRISSNAPMTPIGLCVPTNNLNLRRKQPNIPH